MRGWRWWVAGGLVALVLVLMGGNTLMRYLGGGVERMTPEVLSACLSPSYEITRPEGAGPFPTALLLSGCDGPRDNMQRWAAALAEAGWASVMVDSHGPRGFTELEVWRLVCAAQLLVGAERAGDVAVALADARQLPFVDPDRMALIGASHGGWSALDLLSLMGEGTRPYNLTRWPEGFEGDAPDGLRAVLTLYPYCGPGSLVQRDGWATGLPVAFILVEGDTITGEKPCLALAERMAAAGRDVTVELYDGPGHGFDQQERSPISPLEFDAEATARALAFGIGFLDAAIGR